MSVCGCSSKHVPRRHVSSDVSQHQPIKISRLRKLQNFILYTIHNRSVLPSLRVFCELRLVRCVSLFARQPRTLFCSVRKPSSVNPPYQHSRTLQEA
eukprot:scaffold10861_cov180-Amphora_coffeaeformis.AAC.37